MLTNVSEIIIDNHCKMTLIDKYKKEEDGRNGYLFHSASVISVQNITPAWRAIIRRTRTPSTFNIQSIIQKNIQEQQIPPWDMFAGNVPLVSVSLYEIIQAYRDPMSIPNDEEWSEIDPYYNLIFEKNEVSNTCGIVI